MWAHLKINKNRLQLAFEFKITQYAFKVRQPELSDFDYKKHNFFCPQNFMKIYASLLDIITDIARYSNKFKQKPFLR